MSGGGSGADFFVFCEDVCQGVYLWRGGGGGGYFYLEKIGLVCQLVGGTSKWG